MYSVDTDDVILTDSQPFGQLVTRYTDSNNDGFYHRVSEYWMNSSDASGAGHFILETPLKYLSSDGSDFIAVREGEDSYGGKGEDSFVIREAGHLLIADFNPREDGYIIFDTGLGLTSVAQLADYVTNIDYDDQSLIVDFGPDVSITLLGVQPNTISWNDVSILS